MGLAVWGVISEKSLPVVADEKGVFRTASRKNAKEKFCPSWTEFLKSTSRQVVGNKNQPPTNLVGSPKSNFCPTWAEVKNNFATSCGEVIKTTSPQVMSKSKSLLINLPRNQTLHLYTDRVEVNGKTDLCYILFLLCCGICTTGFFLFVIRFYEAFLEPLYQVTFLSWICRIDAKSNPPIWSTTA